VVQLELGRIDVRFQKPFSLKGWLNEQLERRSHAPLDPDGKRPRKDQATLLKALGYEVLAGMNDVQIVMPAGLLGAVLLTIRGRVSIILSVDLFKDCSIDDLLDDRVSARANSSSESYG